MTQKQFSFLRYFLHITSFLIACFCWFYLPIPDTFLDLIASSSTDSRLLLAFIVSFSMISVIYDFLRVMSSDLLCYLADKYSLNY